jgi:meiotic recombination protein SPO11
MPRLASRKIVDVLGAFLRRNGKLSGEDIRIRTFASSRPFVLSGVDANHRHAAAPDDALVAADVPPSEVRERLAQLVEHVAAQIEAGELPRVELPHLHRTNAIYDEHGNVFVGRYVRTLALDRQHGKDFMRLLLTLETASENLRDGVCTTKRGLFYQHRAKVRDDDAGQVETDRAIASLANVLRLRRKTLGFVESPRGSMFGRLVIRDGEQVIDLSKCGPEGRVVSRFNDDVEIVSSDARVIVLVEKHAVAARLAQARWCDTTRCIMLCGYGFPSLSMREFVKKLVDTLRIPAVIFVDADPAGIRMALTFAHGSISTALETPWLACNALRWAGLYPSDIDRHCRGHEIRLAESDYEAARQLIEHPSHAYISDRIRNEVATLVDRGVKAELDSAWWNDVRRLAGYVQQKLEGDLVTL